MNADSGNFRVFRNSIQYKTSHFSSDLAVCIGYIQLELDPVQFWQITQIISVPSSRTHRTAVKINASRRASAIMEFSTYASNPAVLASCWELNPRNWYKIQILNWGRNSCNVLLRKRRTQRCKASSILGLQVSVTSDSRQWPRSHVLLGSLASDFVLVSLMSTHFAHACSSECVAYLGPKQWNSSASKRVSLAFRSLALSLSDTNCYTFPRLFLLRVMDLTQAVLSESDADMSTQAGSSALAQTICLKKSTPFWRDLK